jgi:hypothetical protein
MSEARKEKFIEEVVTALFNAYNNDTRFAEVEFTVTVQEKEEEVEDPVTFEGHFWRGLLSFKDTMNQYPLVRVLEVACYAEKSESLENASGKGIVTRALARFLKDFPTLTIQMFVINDMWRQKIDQKIAQDPSYPWKKAYPRLEESNEYRMQRRSDKLLLLVV